MRKANRAITDLDEIKTLIDSCDTIRLGFVDGDEAYIVPLSFGFEAENGEFTFYVHGAKAGRRHTLAKKSGRVCVEADVCSGFVELEQGSQTADYKSFIGYGEISTVTGEEAVKALTLLCRHCGFDEMAAPRRSSTQRALKKSSSANFPQSSDLNNQSL